MTDHSSSPLCPFDDLPPGGVIEVQSGSGESVESLIVGRRGDGVRAWLNVCPHAGRSLSWAPGRFLIENDLLICAAHGASFEMDQGRCVHGPCRGASLTAVAVEVRDGAVYQLTP